ncbi:MAG TPA: AtpZ/AtpI family protein [Bacteroidales bacterium]|nr:AtpZ/AtpI family protein [Bacteroidales bacterium]HOR82014.1 AtpZ/AtpI family protein [Bacteroidales bacterium]HPJ91290.1 AtpZ/AtpI family protein [Bacteroidales bacterium]
MSKQEKFQKMSSSYLKYTGMAFQMLAIILLFTFGGIKLDKCLVLSFPIFTVVLSLTGVILGIYVGVKDFFKKKPKK